ncbi:MAG: hypothetical protein D6780_07780, partial [Candidatus Dadabacteria bacterium]
MAYSLKTHLSSQEGKDFSFFAKSLFQRQHLISSLALLIVETLTIVFTIFSLNASPLQIKFNAALLVGFYLVLVVIFQALSGHFKKNLSLFKHYQTAIIARQVCLAVFLLTASLYLNNQVAFLLFIWAATFLFLFLPLKVTVFLTLAAGLSAFASGFFSAEITLFFFIFSYLISLLSEHLRFVLFSHPLSSSFSRLSEIIAPSELKEIFIYTLSLLLRTPVFLIKDKKVFQFKEHYTNLNFSKNLLNTYAEINYSLSSFIKENDLDAGLLDLNSL